MQAPLLLPCNVGTGLNPLTFTSLIGLLTAIALIPAWLLLVRMEEKELIEYWGDNYVNYMRRVPALLPNLKTIIKKHVRLRNDQN